MSNAVLIVDDDRTERRLIGLTLRNTVELVIREAENGKEALRALERDKEQAIKLIILDLDMPVMGGMETLEVIAQDYPHVPVIILTSSASPENTVQAMKLGATDFLAKPVENARLDVSVRNALKLSLMSKELSRLKRQVDDSMYFSDLIGAEGGLADNIKTGKKAAACELPVLITGETGTGKEMFARAVHGESNRKGQPFIAVNCGAIPENLVESILFGHEKGAFTGALQKAVGKFQEANGGTIFLDEIGDLPLDAQVKLLRALQQKEVEPVGASRPVPVDVRVVSATHRDLAKDVRQGRFREDLYFRLNVLHIDLPPLRARKDDIQPMTEYFMEQYCANNRVLPKDITEDGMKKLRHHVWPGNVRELENVINRAMALCDDKKLDADHFSFNDMVAEKVAIQDEDVINPMNPDGSFKTLQELEQEIVSIALAHHDNNITKTARILGIAKSTLYSKIEQLADQKSA